jgi:hypothetical protein
LIRATVAVGSTLVCQPDRFIPVPASRKYWFEAVSAASAL